MDEPGPWLVFQSHPALLPSYEAAAAAAAADVAPPTGRMYVDDAPPGRRCGMAEMACGSCTCALGHRGVGGWEVISQ
jgi:hypothetical protein